MIQSLFRYLKGYVKIRITGYSPERFLNMCCFHGIRIWELKSVGNAYEMYISLAGFRKLRPFARKTHMRIYVTQRNGFPFFVQSYRHRGALFAGILLSILLIWGYSLFIWDIHFEGNDKWTDEALTEFLKTKEVSPGMRKKKVDCPGIVKAIRKEYNDIVWVSASINGSRLKIQIKENEDTFQEEVQGTEEVSEKPTDLIAEEDGVITGIITRSGVPQVHIGDSVKKGDLLVLGRIDVTDDGGEVTGYQYCHSDADIYADTKLPYQDSIPLSYEKKSYNGKSRYQFYMKIGNWEIQAGILKNQFRHSEKSSLEHQWKLGENFYLPVVTGWRKITAYSVKEEKYSRKELQEFLSRRFQNFCKDLTEKGIQIRQNNVKIQLDEKEACASGTLYLNRKIACEADTEIVTIERKEPDESVRTDD